LEFIKTVNLDTPVHLELASVGDDAFLKEMLLTVAPNVNSIGLNELELAHVFHVLRDKTEKGNLSVSLSIF
jgi:ADP-dependent phosphofructokinase/glucokinase